MKLPRRFRTIRLHTLFFAVWLSLVLWTGSAAGQTLVIDEPTFDFGAVPSNATVVYNSWLRTDSENAKDTVWIDNVKAGCGCVSIGELPKYLAPGDSAEIAIAWQTRAADQPEMSTTVYLFTSARSEPFELVLKAEGGQTGGYPPSISLGKPGTARSAGNRLVLRNSADYDLEIRLITPEVDEFQISLPEKIPAGQSVVGIVRLQNMSRVEPFELSVTLELVNDDQVMSRLTVPIAYGDFSFRPTYTTKK